MYYKAVKDGVIVDVFSDENIVYVRYDDRLNMPMRCRSTESPFGVLASDASVIYALDARDGYDSVSLVEFDDETEYNSIREQLDAAVTPEYVEPDPVDPETVDPSVLDNVQIGTEEFFNIILGVYD